MTSLKTIPLALLATVATAAATPKFALVRVTDIYSSLPSTASLQAELNKEREEVMKDERASQLSNKSNPPEESPDLTPDVQAALKETKKSGTAVVAA